MRVNSDTSHLLMSGNKKTITIMVNNCIESFITSRFSLSPLDWTFHSKQNKCVILERFKNHILEQNFLI